VTIWNSSPGYRERLFVSSDDALREIDVFFKHTHKAIATLIVQEILDEHIAKKFV
jgi:hypothetical protein